MRQSCDLIERILDGMPEGPWIADDRKVVLPPRHELHTSMESLIHHFKLVTEGFRVPAGEVYAVVEGPRGELGCNLVSDGSAQAVARALPLGQPGHAAVASPRLQGRADRRPDRDPGLARPEHGGLRPVQRTARLSRALVRRPCRPRSPKYPTRRAAILPALRLAQERYGWLSPEALRAVSEAIDFSPAYCQSVASFYDMFFLEPVGTHVIEVCTNISCAHARRGRACMAALRGRARRVARARRRGRHASRCARSSASAAAATRPSSRSTSASTSASAPRTRRRWSSEVRHAPGGHHG